MKKLVITALLMFVLVSVSSFADRNKPAFDIGGKRLTAPEMRRVSGRLFILDIDYSSDIVEFDYGQTPYDPDREHCDIIAQNQADDMGLDTRDQSGSFNDYNKVVVEEIFETYPQNRSNEPEEGTSGYYFTSTAGAKEHMGTYTRPTGSRTYTRNMNWSYQNTERSVTVPAGYKPAGVTSQRFVALPRLPFFKRYHW
jgi:hypothetical protein